jgi:4a-hydroxytetrahydrobiopterin dehydratase
MERLREGEIAQRLSRLPGWQVVSGILSRTFRFASFPEALTFVNQVGALAEEAHHHPDIDVRYDRVRLGLVTHDAGGLTEKDFELAEAADSVAMGIRAE